MEPCACLRCLFEHLHLSKIKPTMGPHCPSTLTGPW
ncbi:MAG: hypothetical protein M0036_11300 [Desulfobacteraceae bacterium]|nr:hypothetical protein [Desulfobacteraceae bacterium]